MDDRPSLHVEPTSAVGIARHNLGDLIYGANDGIITTPLGLMKPGVPLTPSTRHMIDDDVLQDDVLARLLTFPNTVITSHQAFLTREALANIADTTLASIEAFERGEPLVNEVLRST